MSCQFTCNGCGNTTEPIYAFGRWQHPQGWFTRASEIDGKPGGLSACSEACIQKIESEGPTFAFAPKKSRGKRKAA